MPCSPATCKPLFLANRRQGSIDSWSRLDRRRVTLCPVAVHLVKRDAMLSHLQPALRRASISVQASCSAVDCGVQCSRLFLHSRCNACKRSRQSVGLIELCATMRAKQFNRCPGRLVLSSPEKKKTTSPHTTKCCKLCKFFAQPLRCASRTFHTGALHIQLAVCVAHVPILKHVILISLTSGTK